ncbi:ribosomal protection-like ABC-F family protein [Abyssisolibacter fermentans]|uniref:ribosomal protection-like ABC-F family protein n=1 Tax=Abyssisolibacter fermentans TaxID=1766203 RepID=UPI00082C0A3B|nr:ABC-F type ribosomal protection protein [Abyssisolibacter fermentans]
MSLLFESVNIKKSFGDRVILKDINFKVQNGDRVAVVGNNGAGKTTLINIIVGSIEQENGFIIWHKKNVKIGYLRQSSYYSQDEYMEVLKQDTIEIKDFFDTVKKLGIDYNEDWNTSRLCNLSGGEKTKFSIAKIWSTMPELLILDEPTNHMDYQGIEWLINELRNYKGTIIVISHDRYFMDKISEKVIEIEDGIAHCYKGNYTSYYNEKKKRYESQLHQYQAQEKYKNKIKSDIRQLNDWALKGHRESTKKEGLKEKYRARAKKKDKQVKSRRKRLEKINVEGIKKPKEEQKIKFDIIGNESSSQKILEARNIAKTLGNKILFNDSSFYIKKGEKIGLFGKNGCGKTTLIKTIMSEGLFDSGEIYVNPSLKVGYLSQDVIDFDNDKTVLEIFDIENYEKRGVLQTLLTNMGFSKSMINMKVKNLSLGEKTRLKLASMIIMKSNILILDEPTNHLDLHSREMLEKTLMKYRGTIIIVSHDRYLMEKLCNKVLVFEDNKIMRIEYSFKEYMDKKYDIKDVEVDNKEKLMIIENKIAELIGELSLLSPEAEKYKKLDKEYQNLIKAKKNLTNSN